jgi:HK97 family phage major capsid protein
MKTLKELGADREALEKRAMELTTEIQTRTLSSDEETELVQINKDMKSVDRQIEVAKAAADLATRAAGYEYDTVHPDQRDPRNRRKTDDEKLKESYSVSRALRSVTGQLKYNEDAGPEREANQEGERIARASGLPIENKPGIFIPDAVFRSDSTTALDAANLNPTSQQAVADGYRAKLWLEELGLTVQTAQPGTNNIPVSDFLADAGFVDEAAMTPVAVAANVRRPSLTAKAIYAKVVNNWYLQATAGDQANTTLLKTLLEAEARTLNINLITRGSGTVASKGLLEMDDVVEVTGANADALSRAALTTLLNSPDSNDASFGNPGWVVSPSIRNTLMNLKVDAGSGQYVWPLGDPMSLLGFKAAVSTLMPTNLSKGTGGATKRGIVFGHFSELIVMRWPVRQIIVNPYSNNDGTETKLISFWDWAARNPKAFARGFFTAATTS